MFVWNENELNNEQNNAVIDDDNILLIACPGSGKTRTLTYKIAYELSRLSNPRKFIIAITYTNRAADEIRERVELLGVDSKQLWIGTIHSFCLEWLLRPYSLYLPELKHGFRIIDSYDSEAIISKICYEVNNENHLSGRDKVTCFDCGYIATSKPSYKLTTHHKNKYGPVKITLKRYHEQLAQNNQIDFEQILFYSLKLIYDKPVICSTLSKLFSYVLIDEYQDTREIQYHIISSILKAGGKSSKLFIVGDPNQSIYQNLGGFPIERKELKILTGLDIKHVELVKNYRSSHKIIDYFQYFKTFDNKIEARGNTADYDSQITFNFTVQSENVLEEVARLIEKNINDFGIAPAEICVLAPRWIHVRSVAKKLMLRLPDYSFDGPGMAPFARDIENFWYKLSRIVLTKPSPDFYMKRSRWAYDVLADLANVGVDTFGITKNKLLKTCNSIELHESDGLTYLAIFFEEIFARLGVDYTQYPSLLEHHKAFFNSANNRIEKLTKEGFDDIRDIDSFKKIFQQRNGITVSSCHGIKGAEFDSVIAFSIHEGCIPHFSDENGPENAKKLLYVMASRARKNIHFISETNKFNRAKYEYQPTDVLRGYDYPYNQL